MGVHRAPQASKVKLAFSHCFPSPKTLRRIGFDGWVRHMQRVNGHLYAGHDAAKTFIVLAAEEGLTETRKAEVLARAIAATPIMSWQYRASAWFAKHIGGHHD